MATALAKAKYCERRRSYRASTCVNLLIRGVHGLWEETTYALSGNAHGVLVALGTRVAIGEKVVIRNTNNLAEKDGHVVSLGRTFGRRWEVGIEFTEPDPAFWVKKNAA